MVFFSRKRAAQQQQPHRAQRCNVDADLLDELFTWLWLVLDDIHDDIATIRERQDRHMATSKEARDAVFALGAKIDKVIDHFGDHGIPAEVQADIDAIEVEAKAQGVKLDAAVVEPAPDPVVPPDEDF